MVTLKSRGRSRRESPPADPEAALREAVHRYLFPGQPGALLGDEERFTTHVDEENDGETRRNVRRVLEMAAAPPRPEAPASRR